MGKGDMSLKRCSTSTDVEADDDAVKKAIESLQNAKRVLDDLETKLNPEKHTMKVNKGIKELVNSMEELADTMDTLDATLEKRARIQKKKDNVEVTHDHECCYEDPDWKGTNDKTLFVQGFNTSLSRDKIKSILRHRFSRCGEMKRVHVPFECLTGVSLGYAFIDVEDTEMGLYCSGSGYGRDKIDVMLAKYRPLSSIDDLEGCARCVLNAPFCCNQPNGGMDLEKDMEIFMNWDEAA